MRALIFINGIITDLAPIADLLRDDDLLVAADGGAGYVLQLGRMPHMLVGDLDSVAPADLTRMQQADVDVRRWPVAKDETDLELAIVAAIDAGAAEIILIGATGGRLDQTIANVLILAQRKWPVPLRIIDGDQTALLLRGPATQIIYGLAGALVSTIPLTTVTGITYSGLTFPLTDHTLTLGSTRALSNEMAATEATVRLEEGLLLLIVGEGARLG